MPNVITAELEDWEDIEGDGWPAILLGNGASIAVWKQFSYARLFDNADLDNDDISLFDALGRTTNFEIVLDALRVSRLVCNQLGHEANQIADRYESIKDALIEAVNEVHVPWIAISLDILDSIGQELLEYESIFSTNYDLLVYWSLMEAAGRWVFGDYFWQDMEFDPSNVQPRWDMTLVHYLHGGLHLYRTADGRTLKRTAPSGSTLLDLLGRTFKGVDMPLFVSEGTSDDKMRVIRRSEYLSFAYQRLVEENRPLVIFGNSLGPQDAHLVRAIAHHQTRPIAISIVPGKDLKIIGAKTSVLNQFPNAPISFFDSTSHPLGRPELEIAP